MSPVAREARLSYLANDPIQAVAELFEQRPRYSNIGRGC